jgi:hypothetical protein
LFRIAIIIFYQTFFIWRILGWALPAIPFFKLCLGFWIMLPQMKGEFYVYNMLLDYIIIVERKLMNYRCIACSKVASFFSVLAKGSLSLTIPYISDEVIVKT